jgi:hypothetical protein
VVRAALVTTGLIVVAVAPGIATAAVARGRGLARLLRLSGAATVVAGLAPKDRPGVPASTVSQLHVAAALVAVVALLAAMVVVAVSGPRRRDRTAATLAATLTVAAGAAFPFLWGTSLYGAAERAVLAVPACWLVGLVRPLGRRSGPLPAVDELALPPAPAARGAGQLPGAAEEAVALQAGAAAGAGAHPGGGGAGHLVAEGAVGPGPDLEGLPAPRRAVPVPGADQRVGDLVEDGVAHHVHLVEGHQVAGQADGVGLEAAVAEAPHGGVELEVPVVQPPPQQEVAGQRGRLVPVHAG